ncbi:energy-coupling factor transport system permease protein [Amphibacillus marinus]|uniref:Energy-coupling factor transport system permease protein n=1 Tax=Amphibacillus marinus TaxID=872970 RepID=A0A1H8TLV6_9BACI|nr:energy-coupling factor transporter transmembrane protein EcfT [Amphibacillus marinus]SEO91584.1 energy-coupling factor transport system permease protein [Amphibacillus marinus]
MNKLMMGRYFSGDSFLHQLDPRTKLFATLYIIALLFFVENIWGFLLLFAVTFFIMHQTGIALVAFINGVKPLIWLILFAVMLRIFFTGGGIVYFRAGPVMLSSFGLITGFYTFSRFVLMIFISTVLTLTTKPIDLTDAIHALLKPLQIFRISINDFALMLSISLRFIPNLLDETTKIVDAQRARGVVFGKGNIIQQMKKLVPIVLPLFASSLKRAEELADVMEVKGYQSDQKRTRYRQLKWQVRDAVALLMIVLLTAAVVFVNRL